MMNNWSTKSKYYNEFKKATTLTPKINRHIYDLKWALAFGEISFDNYKKKMRELKDDN